MRIGFFVISFFLALDSASELTYSQTLTHPVATSVSFNKSTANNEALFYLGGQFGFPLLFGASSHWFLKRGADGMPTSYLTGTAGFSLGLGTSIAISQQIGRSKIYPTVGIHYLYLTPGISGFPFSAERFLSALLGLNFNSFNNKTFKQITVGVLIGEVENRDHLKIFPVLSLSWTHPL